MTRVLLVDDDVDACSLLGMHLSRRGFVVDTAETLREAKSLLQERTPDALITDLELPDGSGFTLLAAGRPAKLRLAIVLSGYSRSEDRAASLQAGFDVHLQKPVDAHDMIRLLSEGLTPIPR